MKQLAANLSEEHDTLLRFNSLLIDISTIFISLPVDQIDSKIEEAQHRICTFLDLDRSTLWRFDEQEEATLWLTHTYQPAGSLQPPSPMNCIDYFPWLLRKLMDGETVVISNMTELPAEAVRDRESFNLFNSKSGVFIPLSVGQGPLLGVLTFAAMREERDWNENLVDGFIVVAQMFANAIAHKQHEMSLRESEARLILTTNAAGAGLWNMLTDTGSVWVSKKTRDLFHFASDEEISDASFYKVMHPEDRQPMKQIVQQAIQTGETFSCEYRIVLPDGTIRWIAARGQLHHGSVAVLILGIAKAGFGGGIGFVATPLLALFIPVADAAAILLPILIAVDFMSISHYRGVYDRPSLRLMLPAAAVGIVLGALLFQAFSANDEALKRAMGAMALLFVAYQAGQALLLGALEGKRPSAAAGVTLSVLSGFTSTLAHAGGPPATMYLLPQKLPRNIFAGTAAWYFTVVNLLKVPPYAMLGLLRVGNLTLVALLLPVAYIGTRLGVLLNRRFDDVWFNRVVYFFLTVTGLELLSGGAVTRALLG